jgi:general secretion pathway protein D
LLGGIFEEQDTKSWSGIPGLGQLPFFRYFFAQEHKERIENEIVFILVPHVVRGQELSDLNQRAIDIGTANSLDIRRVTKPSNPAAPAQQSPVQQQQPPAPTPPQGANQPPAQAPQQAANLPPATATAAPPASTGSTSLRLDPPNLGQTVGSTFTIQVIANNAQDVYSAPMQISYDPRTLQFVSISNGDLLSRDGQPVALVHREETDSGIVQANATRPPGSGGINGNGSLYMITFRAKAPGDSQVTIVRPSLRNSSMAPVPATGATAAVSIK